MLKRIVFISMILATGCRDKQPVAPPTQETSNAHTGTSAQETSPVYPNSVKSEMQIIVSPEDLRKMLAAQHAVVFVGVDWSVNSNMARLHVQDFIKAWNQQNPGSVVTFHRLNLTQQKSPVWDAVGQWLQEQSVPRQIMVAGAGSLIWVSKGKVDYSVLNAATASTTELIETTQSTFKEVAASAQDKKHE
jgi:hypothetical protein